MKTCKNKSIVKALSVFQGYTPYNMEPTSIFHHEAQEKQEVDKIGVCASG